MDPISITIGGLIIALKAWFIAHKVSIGISTIVGIARAIISGKSAYSAAIKAGINSTIAAALQDFVKSTFGVG